MIDNDEADVLGADQPFQLFDLARPEKGRRPRARHRDQPARLHVELDRVGEAGGLFQPRLAVRRARRGACHRPHSRVRGRVRATAPPPYAAVLGGEAEPRPVRPVSRFSGLWVGRRNY